jgi:hypothetical protein
LIITTNTLAQKIDFNRLCIGTGIEYNLPENDLGKYWNDSPGISFYAAYGLTNGFKLETGFSYADYEQKIVDLDIPGLEIYIINAGLYFETEIMNKINIFTSGGLQSYTFRFVKENYQKSGNNRNESEFGLYFSIGWSYELFPSIFLIPSIKLQNIYSYPEMIIIKSPAFKIIYNL